MKKQIWLVLCAWVLCGLVSCRETVGQTVEFVQACKKPALDGSLTGWEGAKPVQFSMDDNKVEVRCMFDESNIFLRWDIRKAWPFTVTPMFDETRIFTHENMRDEVSFYFQGNPSGVSGGETGRLGDFRIVFSIIESEGGVAKAVALGMFPKWNRPNGKTVLYESPIRTVFFEHVDLLSSAELGFKLSDDKNGAVIAARLPVQDLPIQAKLEKGLKTRADFSATMGGVTKFWWANTGRQENTYTCDEPSEAKIFPGSWSTAVFVGQ